MIQALIRKLTGEHVLLESEIRRESRAKAPDQFRLNTLKRRKLAVKDRLSVLRTRLASA